MILLRNFFARVMRRLTLALTGRDKATVSILTPYGSRYTYFGTPYPPELSRGLGWHRGVDIGAHMVGAAVLAAADGSITAVGEPLTQNCGYGVVIHHPQFDVDTLYCHLQELAQGVKEGVPVKRGDVIGRLGATGAVGPVPHLHFEVRRPSGETEDPVTLIVGCFDPERRYPKQGTPVLTWPIKC